MNDIKLQNNIKKNGTLTVRWLSTLSMVAGLICTPTQNTFADSSKDDGSDSKDKSIKSQIQSEARPYKLSIIDPVMQAGSDVASRKFQSVLPGMQQFIKSYIPEAHNNLKSPLAFTIDPSKLTLSTKSDVRMYFAYEGAGYHNTIGFNTKGAGVSSGNPKIIFPDASSSLGYGGSGTGVRSASDPLLPGDFVNLGSFNGGTKFDFFLIANGANGGSSVYSTTEAVNPDRINHVATFSPTFWGVANSPYLFIAYEDLLGGGDKDFNDVIVALDIGAANVSALLATPEPATWLTLGSLLGLAVWIRHRSRNQFNAIATNSLA